MSFDSQATVNKQYDCNGEPIKIILNDSTVEQSIEMKAQESKVDEKIKSEAEDKCKLGDRKKIDRLLDQINSVSDHESNQDGLTVRKQMTPLFPEEDQYLTVKQGINYEMSQKQALQTMQRQQSEQNAIQSNSNFHESTLPVGQHTSQAVIIAETGSFSQEPNNLIATYNTEHVNTDKSSLPVAQGSTTNQTLSAQKSSPIKQNIDSTNERSSLVVPGSSHEEAIDNIIDCIDNISPNDDFRAHQLTFGQQNSLLDQEMHNIAEQDIEESNPNVPQLVFPLNENFSTKNSLNKAEIDMNNFMLLSEKQRAEKFGEQVDLTKSLPTSTRVDQETEKKAATKLNEQVIFSRLPQDYFKSDQEQVDLDEAAIDIQMMREGFANQIGETEHKMKQIEDILQPEKFIQKCFGEMTFQENDSQEQLKHTASPPKFLFEEVIKKVPTPPKTKKKKRASSSQGTSRKSLHKSASCSKSPSQFLKNTKELDERVQSSKKLIPTPRSAVTQSAKNLKLPHQEQQNVDLVSIHVSSSRGKSPILAFQQASPMQSQREISPRSDEAEQGPVIHKRKKRMGLNTGKNRPCIQDGQSIPQDSHRRAKALRMADYFTIDEKNRGQMGTLNRSLNSDLESVSPRPEVANESVQKGMQVLATSVDKSVEGLTFLNSQLPSQRQAMSDEKREKIERELERDILQNVDINFVFNKGTGLRDGLLDQERIFHIMSKLKDIALRQISRGSKEIDYKEITEYIKSKECMFRSDFDKSALQEFDSCQFDSRITKNKESEALSSEPYQPRDGPAQNESERSRRWKQCVGFLRSNPKLLMQMIPSEEDQDIDEQTRALTAIVRKSRIHKRIEDAKKYGGKKQENHSSPKKKQIQPQSVEVDQPILAIADPQPKLLWKRKMPVPGSLTLSSQNNSISATEKFVKQIQPPVQIQSVPNAAVMADSSKDRMAVQSPRVQEENQSGNRESPPLSRKLNRKRNQQHQVFKSSDGLFNFDRFKSQGSNDDIEAPRFYKSNAHSRAGTGMLQTHDNKLSNIASKAALGQVVSVLKQRFNRNVCSNSSFGSGAHLKVFSRETPIEGYVSRQVLLSDALSQQGDGKRRPTTAANSGNPKLNRGTALASNAILRQHMLSRSSVRNQLKSPRAYNYSSTQFTKGSLPGMNAQKANSTPFVAPAAPMQQRRNLAPKSNSTLNNRAWRRDGANCSTSPNGRATLPRTFNISREDEVNHQAGVLQFYPTPQEFVPSAAALKRQEKERQSSKGKQSSKGRASDVMKNSYRQSIQSSLGAVDRSILGEEASVLQHSQPSVDNQHGRGSPLQQASRRSGTAGHAMQHQSARTEASQGGELPSQDMFGLSVMEIPVTSPIRFEEQSQLVNRLKPAPEPFKDSVSKQQSSFGEPASSKIDWAYSPLCVLVLKNEAEFNPFKDIKLFSEDELDYVIDMMRSKFQDFERTEIMRPFYLKALSTLRTLLTEQNFEQRFKKLQSIHSEITIENTLKLLLRCKLVFHTRDQLVSIFEQTLIYELKARDMKQMLDEESSYKVTMEKLNIIKDTAAKMTEAGQMVIKGIGSLRAEKGPYKQTFVFKRRDLVKTIKNEISEVKKLTQIFRPKRIDESSDSEEIVRIVKNDKLDQVKKADSLEEKQKMNHVKRDIVEQQQKNADASGEDSSADSVVAE